jgi:hypothetical protein
MHPEAAGHPSVNPGNAYRLIMARNLVNFSLNRRFVEHFLPQKGASEASPSPWDG